MNYDEMVNQVQHRLELPQRARAVRALRATLQTLGERLHPDEAEDLASNLPMEIDRFVGEAESGQRFNYSEFVSRVATIEKSDPPDAAYHAQQILELVAEAVPAGEMRQIRDSLPDDFDDLFDRISEQAS